MDCALTHQSLRHRHCCGTLPESRRHVQRFWSTVGFVVTLTASNYPMWKWKIPSVFRQHRARKFRKFSTARKSHMTKPLKANH